MFSECSELIMRWSRQVSKPGSWASQFDESRLTVHVSCVHEPVHHPGQASSMQSFCVAQLFGKYCFLCLCGWKQAWESGWHNDALVYGTCFHTMWPHEGLWQNQVIFGCSSLSKQWHVLLERPLAWILKSPNTRIQNCVWPNINTFTHNIHRSVTFAGTKCCQGEWVQ